MADPKMVRPEEWVEDQHRTWGHGSTLRNKQRKEHVAQEVESGKGEFLDVGGQGVPRRVLSSCCKPVPQSDRAFLKLSAVKGRGGLS